MIIRSIQSIQNIQSIQSIQSIQNIPPKSTSYTQGIQDDNRITRNARNTIGDIWVELRAHHPHVVQKHEAQTPLVTFKLCVGPDHVDVVYIKEREGCPIKVVPDRVKSNLVNRIVARYLGPGIDKHELVYVMVCTATNFQIGDLHINSGTWRVRTRCLPGYRWVTLDGDACACDQPTEPVQPMDDDVRAFLLCIGLDSQGMTKTRRSPNRKRFNLGPHLSYACSGQTMSSFDLERQCLDSS